MVLLLFLLSASSALPAVVWTSAPDFPVGLMTVYASAVGVAPRALVKALAPNETLSVVSADAEAGVLWTLYVGMPQPSWKLVRTYPHKPDQVLAFKQGNPPFLTASSQMSGALPCGDTWFWWCEGRQHISSCSPCAGTPPRPPPLLFMGATRCSLMRVVSLCLDAQLCEEI